jgi:hypothetical protein
MEANAVSVVANGGAAYAENKILRGMAGNDDTGGRALIGYAYLSNLQRGVRSVTNRGEAYALTHDIFFATNFGRITVTGVDITGHASLLDRLVVEHANDTDVLGELIMASKCIGHWSSAMDTALSAFESQWAALDRNDFAQNYHPILVGGLLFSMLD